VSCPEVATIVSSIEIEVMSSSCLFSFGNEVEFAIWFAIRCLSFHGGGTMKKILHNDSGTCCTKISASRCGCTNHESLQPLSGDASHYVESDEQQNV
jgi:hypothetical protein